MTNETDTTTTETSKPKLTPEEMRENTIKWAEKEFSRIMNQITYSFKHMSARQTQRAIKNALYFNLNDDKMKFHSKIEAVVGGYLAQLMDVRTVIMGNKMINNEEKGEGNVE